MTYMKGYDLMEKDFVAKKSMKLSMEDESRKLECS